MVVLGFTMLDRLDPLTHGIVGYLTDQHKSQSLWRCPRMIGTRPWKVDESISPQVVSDCIRLYKVVSGCIRLYQVVYFSRGHEN